MFFKIGHTDELPNEAKLSLLGDLLKDRCFNQLRTQQQLGRCHKSFCVSQDRIYCLERYQDR